MDLILQGAEESLLAIQCTASSLLIGIPLMAMSSTGQGCSLNIECIC